MMDWEAAFSMQTSATETFVCIRDISLDNTEMGGNFSFMPVA
jgi:hypothetical protein